MPKYHSQSKIEESMNRKIDIVAFPVDKVAASEHDEAAVVALIVFGFFALLSGVAKAIALGEDVLVCGHDNIKTVRSAAYKRAPDAFLHCDVAPGYNGLIVIHRSPGVGVVRYGPCGGVVAILVCVEIYHFDRFWRNPHIGGLQWRG